MPGLEPRFVRTCNLREGQPSGPAAPAAISVHGQRELGSNLALSPPAAPPSPSAFAAFDTGPAPGPAPLLPGLRVAAPRPRHGCRRRRHLSVPPPQQQLYRQAHHGAGPLSPSCRAAGRGWPGKGRGLGAVLTPGARPSGNRGGAGQRGEALTFALLAWGWAGAAVLSPDRLSPPGRLRGKGTRTLTAVALPNGGARTP